MNEIQARELKKHLSETFGGQGISFGLSKSDGKFTIAVRTATENPELVSKLVQASTKFVNGRYSVNAESFDHQVTGQISALPRASGASR
jgi:hypothetical protein